MCKFDQIFFDRDQKDKEHRENLREQRLRQKEMERLKSYKIEKKSLIALFGKTINLSLIPK